MGGTVFVGKVGAAMVVWSLAPGDWAAQGRPVHVQ